MRARMHVALIGRNGHGKSTLARTLPGSKLVFAFDPNADRAWEDCPDATIIPLQPDIDEVDDTPVNIKKRVLSTDKCKPELFQNYIKILRGLTIESEEPRKINLPNGKTLSMPGRKALRIPDFDWVVLDGFTYLGRAMHAKTIVEQQKIDAQDQRTDHGITGQKSINHLQKLLSLDNHICVTAHYRGHISEETLQRFSEIEGYGEARRIFPTMFDEVYSCLCKRPREANIKTTFSILTQPTDRHQICRTAIRNLTPEIDVTIPPEGWSNPEAWGLGPIYKKEQEAHKQTKPSQT